MQQGARNAGVQAAPAGQHNNRRPRAGGLLLRHRLPYASRGRVDPRETRMRDDPVPAAGAAPVAARRAEDNPLDIIVRRDQGSAALLLRLPRLPRAARDPHVHQRPRVAAPDVRLDAVRVARPSCCRTSPTTATRRRSPRRASTLIFDVAPLSHAFETSPGERAHVHAMNHELVHVTCRATSRPSEDRRWRRFFLGKVRRASRKPGDAALQLPDDAALHRAALVSRRRRRIPGNVDGRRPRPRAGRLRRDGVSRDGARRRAFLRPAGARVARHAGRFPDRRQRLSLRHALLHVARLHVLAREGDRVGQARRRQRPLLRGQLRAGVRACRWTRPGRTGSPSSTSSSGAISPRCASSRSRRTASSPASALGSVSRMYYDEATGMLYGAFRYPGRRRVRRRARHARRQRSPAGRHQGRDASTVVASFAYDPASGTAFYTNDNHALRDLMAVDVHTGEARMLLENARIGDLAFNPVDRSLIGVRHAIRPRDARAHSVSLHRLARRSTRSRTNRCPTISTSRPMARCCRRSMSDVNGATSTCACGSSTSCSHGDVKPLSEFASGSRSRRASCSRRDGRYLYGSSYYTGVSNIFRYEVATGKVEAVSNAETGFFRPVPLADGRLVVLAYTGDGFVPGDHRSEAARGFERDHVPRRRGRGEVSRWSRPGRCRRPGTVDDEALVTSKGPVPAAGAASQLANAYPGAPGLQELRRRSATTSTSTIRCRSRNIGITAAYTPTGDLPGRRARARRDHRPTTSAGAAACVEPLGFLRPVRADQAQPQGLRRQGRLRLARSSTTSRAS